MKNYFLKIALVVILGIDSKFVKNLRWNLFNKRNQKMKIIYFFYLTVLLFGSCKDNKKSNTVKTQISLIDLLGLEKVLDINLSSFENINQNGGCGKFMVYGFLDSLNVIVFYGKVDDSLETGNDFYKFNNNLLEGIQFHKYDKIENVENYCSDVYNLNTEYNPSINYFETNSLVYFKKNKMNITILIDSATFVLKNGRDSIKIQKKIIKDVQIGSIGG